MKRVLTVGVYDVLHLGHVLLFQHAKEIDEEVHLIVAVQDEEQVLKYKPAAKMIYTTEERLYMVNSIKYVNEVCLYRDIDKDIKNINFDVFAKGPDQNHEGFKRAVEWCNQNNKEVIVIPRTENISSTLLRELNIKL